MSVSESVWCECVCGVSVSVCERVCGVSGSVCERVCGVCECVCVLEGVV